MGFLQQAILSNANILVPTIRTLSYGLVGFLTLSGLTAIFQPRLEADMFRVPAFRAKDNDNKKKERLQGEELEHYVRPWMVVYGVRALTTAALMLTFLRLGELRWASVQWLLMDVVGVADSCAAYFYGGEGAVTVHLVVTLALCWIGPVGLVLFPGKSG